MSILALNPPDVFSEKLAMLASWWVQIAGVGIAVAMVAWGCWWMWNTLREFLDV